jgi:hypothetical protein
MVNSGTEPEVIFIDRVENGQCRLLVRWNIIESIKEDPMDGETRTSYDYSERVIWWSLSHADVGTGTLKEIRAYIVANEKAIVPWATATDLNYNGMEMKEE